MTAVRLGFPRSYTWLALALMWAAAFVSGATAQGPIPECNEPQACRERALDARSRGAYETFHDFAWRAVQTGRPNDPELMYLLARAQALSGRRRDALIRLRRLAEAGFIITDAATDDDFRHVRELSEWQYVEALSRRPRPIAPGTAPAAAVAKPPTPDVPPATPAIALPPKPAAALAAPPTARAAVIPKPAAPAAPPAPPAAVPPKLPAGAPPSSAVALPKLPAGALPGPAVAPTALRIERANVEEAARFSTRPFVPGGFAYDAISRRLLFGDAAGRRLFVVGEGSNRTVDLVRADSAGFDDVTAIAIDARRGDLWVASTAPGGSGGAVHRLQLISGRALARLPVPGQGPARFSDMAVTGDGTIFILDSATPRVLVRRPGATVVELLVPLMTPLPVSITASDDGRFAYVAHREGITRIDVASRRAAVLNAAKGLTLAGFEFIRWHRGGLVGGQVQPDGSRGLVRLQLNRNRRAVTAATLIEGEASSEDATVATISGGDLYYLVAGPAEAQGDGAGLMDVRVRRIKLP